MKTVILGFSGGVDSAVAALLLRREGFDVRGAFLDVCANGAAEDAIRTAEYLRLPLEVIDARMSRAANEVSHWDGYDYVLVNDDVEQCFAHVRTILAAERLKRSRQTGLIGFIRKLTR